jgi:hypothetical protein
MLWAPTGFPTGTPALWLARFDHRAAACTKICFQSMQLGCHIYLFCFQWLNYI